MNNLEKHRRIVTEARIRYEMGDPRQIKRFERGNFSETYIAYINGDYNGSLKNPRPNPYPPGRRHDQFERGMKLANPMGDWIGHNL